jgi:hypothetical protein
VILRYVVLLHNCPDGTAHYDLMLEEAQHLATYRLSALPAEDSPVTLDRIHNHEMRFLSYEGAVNAGKGSVVRIEAGFYSREADLITFTGGNSFSGPYRFDELNGQALLSPLL